MRENAGTTLPREVHALVRVSGALARREGAMLEGEMSAARQVVDPLKMEEALVQSHLFLGFPAALNALALWRRISGRPAPEPSVDDPTSRASRGEEVCRRVYGAQYGSLRRNIRGIHPDLDRWMVEEGYGKVLGRSGLDLGSRELCIVSLLAVLGVPVQLHSHLRGALRVGVSADRVAAVLDAVESLVSPAHRHVMWETWARVHPGRSEGMPPSTEKES